MGLQNSNIGYLHSVISNFLNFKLENQNQNSTPYEDYINTV